MVKIRHLSNQEKAEMWDRAARGEPLSSIARALGRTQSGIHMHMSMTGGVRPSIPTRSPRCLSVSDREEISRGLAAGESLRAIASRLGRAPSTISREVTRNGGPTRYRAGSADRRAWRQAKRPKVPKLTNCPRLHDVVEAKLAVRWSPEQISNWLRVAYPHDEEMRVSHETIYLSLYVQGRGTLRRELHHALRSGRAIRRAKNLTREKQRQIFDMVNISERPGEVEDRAVPGHWEGDLILGTKNSSIATLVERSSRYVMLMQLDRRDALTVNAAIARKILELPTELRRSITWDQGKEMSRHREFTIDTGIQVYFCDPSSPWQRGTNENTNGLLRQYFPKRTSLAGFTQEQLDEVARELNERPRKTLNWVTPLEALAATVAETP